MSSLIDSFPSLAASALSEARVGALGLWRQPRRLLGWLVFIVAYALLDRASVLFSAQVSVVTLWDLSGGLALALLIIEGPWAAPIVAVADLAANILVHGQRPPLFDMAGASVIEAMAYAAAAAWIRAGGANSLARQSGLLRLTLAAVLAGVVHASVDLGLLGRWSDVARISWLSALPTGVLGAFIGIMIVSPFALLPTDLGPRLTRRTVGEAALQALTVLAILALIFPSRPEDRFRYFYLLFLPQIWIAVRFGVVGAMLANFIVQAGLVLFFVFGPGHRQMVFGYQFRFLALSMSSLFLGCAVTERRGFEAALRQRQDQLARVSRLSLAGEMAAALAHELNQPLLATIAFTRSAQRMLRADPATAEGEASGAMDEAVSQAERAGSIVRALREFIGKSETTRGAFAFDALVREAAALIEPECARQGVRLVKVLDRVLPKAWVDPIQIQQVLINLVQNALDVLGDRAGPRVVVIQARRTSEGQLEVEVRDTGPGVPPEVAQRLFEPFATGKPLGMGLGLTVCRGLVEAHGGRLWLASNEAGRCAFRFTLPVAKPAKRGARA